MQDQFLHFIGSLVPILHPRILNILGQKRNAAYKTYILSFSVRVYVKIISKYATKIVGTQNRQEACVHGTQDQKQSTFSKFKPVQ